MSVDKVALAKNVTTIVVGLGVGTIVKTIIRDNVIPATATQKVTVGAGTIVLAMMVGDATSNYTDAKIDAIVAWWASTKSKAPTPA